MCCLVQSFDLKIPFPEIMFEAQTETQFEFVVQVQYHTGQKKTKKLIAIRMNRLNHASPISLLKNILTVAPGSTFPPFIISKQDSKTTLEYYFVYQTAFELLVLKCFQKISHRLVHTSICIYCIFSMLDATRCPWDLISSKAHLNCLSLSLSSALFSLCFLLP